MAVEVFNETTQYILSSETGCGTYILKQAVLDPFPPLFHKGNFTDQVPMVMLVRSDIPQLQKLIFCKIKYPLMVRQKFYGSHLGCIFMIEQRFVNVKEYKKILPYPEVA